MSVKFGVLGGISRFFLIPFVISLLISALIFVYYNVSFMYCIEDAFFEREMQNEARFIEQQYKQSGELVTPHLSYLSIASDLDTVPLQVKQEYLSAPETCSVVQDDGRYYLIEKLDIDIEAYLVSDATDELLVRPNSYMIYHKLFLVTGVILLVSTMLVLFLAYLTIKPIKQLANQVSSLKPNELPTSLAKDYPDNEIGMLATSIEGSLLRINKFVQREKDFTRDVSHELRTPVSIVQNSTELLKKDPQMSQKSQLVLARIEKACIQMGQTINTVLALAREENKELQGEDTLVLPVLEDVIISNHHLLDDKDLKLNIQVEKDEMVGVSHSVFFILLSNLLSNAFQYTEYGSVNVWYKNKRLVVENTGKGIDKDILDDVFKPLVKGTKSNGFGIGLSLVYRLCESVGAKLQLNQLDGHTQVIIDF